MIERDKAILAGLFLSKYNQEALSFLGFSSYQEAFNVLGLALGVAPASIKNYRDEFAPLFPQSPRKGWQHRQRRDYCLVIFERYQNCDLLALGNMVKSFFISNPELEDWLDKKALLSERKVFGDRLVTGKAAETYFLKQYSRLPQFQGFVVEDTRDYGCGFDFKLSRGDDFLCVEVKGLRALSGGLLMTEKEYRVAEQLGNQYALFVVKNFIDKPHHEVIVNPLRSRLTFVRREEELIRLTYHAQVTTK